MNYYTLLVTLCNDEKLVYRNLRDEDVIEIRKTIWTQGVKKKIDHTKTELISPLIITKALIIEQDEFFNETI